MIFLKSNRRLVSRVNNKFPKCKTKDFCWVFVSQLSDPEQPFRCYFSGMQCQTFKFFFIECLCFLHEIGLRKDGNIKGSKSIVSPVSHTFLKIIPISLNILGKRLPKQYRALNTTTKSNMTVRDLPKDAAVHRCSFKKLL